VRDLVRAEREQHQDQPVERAGQGCGPVGPVVVRAGLDQVGQHGQRLRRGVDRVLAGAEDRVVVRPQGGRLAPQQAVVGALGPLAELGEQHLGLGDVGAPTAVHAQSDPDSQQRGDQARGAMAAGIREQPVQPPPDRRPTARRGQLLPAEHLGRPVQHLLVGEVTDLAQAVAGRFSPQQGAARLRLGGGR
jgi:hypothetical protein